MDSKKRFKIHLIQWNVLAGQLESNLERAAELMETLSLGQDDLILLPEMFSTGFLCAHPAEMAEGYEQTLEWISSQAVSRSVSLAGSVPIWDGRGVSNTLVVVDPEGKRKGSYVKTHLFPLTGEGSAFQAGDRASVFNWNGTAVGLMICFDLRFPELGRKICLDGASLILVSAQWPLARVSHFVDLVKVRAMENQLYVAAVNSCGDDGSGLVLGGGSLVAGPMGEILGQLKEGEGVLTVPVDLEEVERVRREFPVLSLRRPDIY